MIKRFAIIALWISVLAAGIWLRFDHLAKRPMHADEATGARITARFMEAPNQVPFDPKHFHGPLLASLARTFCWMHGETGWHDLTKGSLRSVPAVAGCLLLLLPLACRRRLGDGPMLLAAALLATSPLLVYYSRMFIHESLLVTLGIGVLVALWRYPRWGLPGLLIGLMFATKESFAISLLAWTGAAMVVMAEQRAAVTQALMANWRRYALAVTLSLVAGVLVATAFYTNGFRHWQGALDALRTFFVYETVAGHDKGAGYYLQLLLVPKKSGGVWWFETPLLVLAVIAYASTFGRSAAAATWRVPVRFLAYAAAGHFLIYTFIAYKTPWLACLPWAHVCLLGGLALVALPRFDRRLLAVLAIFIAATLATQWRQTRYATDRYASNPANPYAYVPTANDVEALTSWLNELAKVAPGGTLEPVAVVGSDYWPLPWYLRSMPKTGYWAKPPPGMEKFTLVLALPATAEEVGAALAATHQMLPRRLRDGVPLYVFLRNDVWQRWMDQAAP